ncbi:quinone oxidoreductase family protein [Gordonia shandongensis]|uniref:quinone oxidoreductase family protein n=1 Tax=Gordonia shandongensis TaxID=376351 RepID=UPI000411FFE1|nr:quinone oxidoreductase [Gordonia shandongensis]
MRAIHVSAHGGPEVLDLVDLPDPRPAPGQVLVAVDTAGVNFIDTYRRAGIYPSSPPYVPGVEGAGEVVELGDGVTDLRVGDRVAWCDADASYAELVTVRAERLLPVPAEVDLSTAGSSLLRGLTAHYLLDGSAHPTRGDTVLIHAGAGGVGSILTRWAARRGIRVITTVSSAEKEALSRRAGAAEVVRYGDDLVERVRDLTDGVGVSTVYDGVGAATFDQSLAATAVRGTVVLFGAASGPVPPVDLQRLNTAGSLSVTRPTLAHFIADPAEFAWRADEFFRALVDGVLDVKVGRRFPLDAARDAHRALESRATAGTTGLAVGRSR